MHIRSYPFLLLNHFTVPVYTERIKTAVFYNSLWIIYIGTGTVAVVAFRRLNITSKQRVCSSESKGVLLITKDGDH